MNKARNRAHGTVTDVRCGTGDSTRSRDTAKNRAQDVSDTLTEKFRVGAVLGTRHTVSHHCRKERFNSAEHGNRKCRLEHLLHHFEADVREVRHRESARDVVLHTNRHYTVTVHRIIPAKDLHQDRRNDNRNEGTRNLRSNLRPQNADRESDNAHNHGIDVHGTERRNIKFDFANSVSRVSACKSKTEEVRHLAKRNNNSDTRRKTDRHRIRDELDNRTKLSKTKNDEEDTGQERCRSKAIVTVLAHNAVDNHDECARRAANLEAGTTQQRNDEARDNGRVKALFRTHARSDSKRNRQGESQNANDQARHQVASEILASVAALDRADDFRGDCRDDTSQILFDGFLGANIRHLRSPYCKSRPKFRNLPQFR